MRKMTVVLIVVLYTPCLAAAQNVSPSLLHDNEHNDMIYINKKTSETHARASFSIQKQQEKRYSLILEGKGNYDEYEDVQWVSKADMAEEGAIILPLQTSTVIQDKNKNALIEFRKTFDYENKKIIFERIDDKGEVLKEKEYRIKGPTCDDLTLIHCLKTFVVNLGDKGYRHFYLLSNEPKLYRVVIIDRGEETLSLPFGEVDAVKIQLMADLGPLTQLAASLVPDTYVWYTTQYPHYWVQYEGLEADPESTNIRIELLKRTPAISSSN